mmetsp:Transcript_18214/g.42606  ORF Transcript_18214/g.42606 Transcript_18214/m.42606 type:complete len:222 (+) Transcript_18214:1521-2186(+)
MDVSTASGMGGKAVRSTFPLAVIGICGSCMKRRGRMIRGKWTWECASIAIRAAASNTSPLTSTIHATSTAAPPTPTAQDSTKLQVLKAYSTSPNSMRSPLSFTWKSRLPSNSSDGGASPSVDIRPMSPVLYALPAVAHCDAATNRKAVSSGSVAYPLAIPKPAMQTSPSHARSTGSPAHAASLTLLLSSESLQSRTAMSIPGRGYPACREEVDVVITIEVW